MANINRAQAERYQDMTASEGWAGEGGTEAVGTRAGEGAGIMDLLGQSLPQGAAPNTGRSGRLAKEIVSGVRLGGPVTGEVLPAYASYSSWLRLLDALAESLPSLIDEHYLASLGLSESSIKPLRSTLRFFELITREGRVTRRLEGLVEALGKGGAARMEALKETVHYSYSHLFSSGFELKSATMEQLRLYFGAMGARGQIQQKCSTFFLNLARDAGLELPHHLMPPAPLGLGRRGPSAAGPTIEERREWTQTFSSELGLLLGIFPKLDVDWPEEKKQLWFKDFMRMMRIAETGEEPSTN